MVSIQELTEDERHAINMYERFLNQGVKNPKIIPIIKRIILEEKKHIKQLNKINKLKAI